MAVATGLDAHDMLLPRPRGRHKRWRCSGCRSAGRAGCGPRRCRCRAPGRPGRQLAVGRVQHRGQQPRSPARRGWTRRRRGGRWGQRLGTEGHLSATWKRVRSQRDLFHFSMCFVSQISRSDWYCANSLINPRLASWINSVPLLPNQEQAF